MPSEIKGSSNFDSDSAGKVLQVVQGVSNANVSSTSTAYADANLSATITPSSTSSKILVLVSQTGFSNGAQDVNFNIVRESTQIVETRYQSKYTSQEFAGNFLNYLDSPATTSALTYKTQVKTTASTIYLNWGPTGYSTITLMEIGV
jgi:hypothetical protein